MESIDSSREGRVLVVEDEALVRMLVVQTLEEAGFDVSEAAEAQGALEVLRRDNEIRLIVTDVGLPGLNGRRLADEARARRPDMKVLFMTGYSRNAIVHQGRLDPGVELIQKPITQDQFAGRIRNLLDRTAV